MEQEARRSSPGPLFQPGRQAPDVPLAQQACNKRRSRKGNQTRAPSVPKATRALLLQPHLLLSQGTLGSQLNLAAFETRLPIQSVQSTTTVWPPQAIFRISRCAERPFRPWVRCRAGSTNITRSRRYIHQHPMQRLQGRQLVRKRPITGDRLPPRDLLSLDPSWRPARGRRTSSPLKMLHGRRSPWLQTRRCRPYLPLAPLKPCLPRLKVHQSEELASNASALARKSPPTAHSQASYNQASICLFSCLDL